MTGFRERIDTNKNNRIDINSQCNEINNFILDKNKGEENLNELGKYLNDLDPLKLDNLGIKDALQSYFTTPERTKLDQGIKNKVNKNEPLTKKELNLLYLEMISEGNNQIGFQKQKFDSQQLKFDSNKPIDQICNGALIGFIRTKYKFPTYTGKKVKIDLPNQQHTRKPSTNPINRMKESQKIGGNINLPENIGEIKESEADFYCNRLITWAEQNFPNEIDKAKRQLQIRYKYKDKPVEQAYIKYETLLIAFNKYCEIVSKNHTKLITSPEIGYKDDEEFKRQMNQIEYFESEISKRYPGIDKILEIVKKFYEEVDQNKKKFFGEDKDGIKLKKAENDYKHFNEFIKNKYKEYDIKKTEEALKKTPNSGDEAVEYFLNYNKIAEFQNEINQKKSSYGDSIRKYTSYTKNLQSIHEKYNLEQYKDTLSKYNYDVQRLSHGIDFGKFQKYTNKIKYETSLQNGMKNVSLLGNLLMDKTNIYFPFKEIRDDEIQKQIKQEETDKWRDDLKNNNPRIHWLLTSLSGLYNGIIDFTIGSASSLGVLILGLIGGKDETLAQMDHKEEFDNRFKINTSSSQTEEVYNSETGEFNFNLDNTTYTVASSISQMLGLIYGGGAIAKGASKAFQIGENVAGKIGLFSSSFITQIGGSYQEAVKGGLSGGEALGYSMLSATMQSGLELISPNEVLLGKGSGITKELIRNACKSGSKESFKMIGKIFTKNVWNEIREENIQEALQTVAGNLVNMTTNGAFGSELGADWSWKNFAATAVITTLTTGITTGTSTGRQMAQLNNSDKSKLIEYIKNNNGTYSDVMEMIDDGIAGTIKIPNVNIQQLQELKGLLTNQKAEATGKTDTGNIDENYIIELPKEAEKFTEILGSKFHEERRQSRLQSDGTYAPRVEKTSDQAWISQHNGQTEVDIANTSFEELPSDWKSENLEAAKVAVELVYDRAKNRENITPDMIEKMAEIVHNRRLERNGTEGSFENQRVSYEQLSELEKEKDRNQLLQAIETVKQGNTDYFSGKSKKIFDGQTGNAESNSKLSDRILNEINEQNKSTKLEELRKEIIEQYKQSTGEELELTDEQLLSILDAHEQDGELGKLKLGQLKVKVKILSEAITDPKVRRFLLEAGFCGRPQEIHKNINIGNQNCEITYRGNYGEMKITNSDGTITNIDFQKNDGESKYLEIFIENGGKIENYTTIENLCKISEEMGAGGKIGFAKELIRNLDNVIEKKILEKLINTENFSENSISYDKYDKRYTFKVLEKFLSFNMELPQKLFNKNFLTQLINSNTFFEARAKVNYQGIELNKIYFHEMIGEYIDQIDLNSCNPELLSDLIIDYHFNKISYNVFLDIKELLRFQIEKGNFLSKEKLKIYRNILNIDKLSNKEKIELHKSLIGKNVAEMFENDIQQAREISKREIADSVLNHESIEQFKDEELSKKYGVNTYNFDGQPFYALAKKGKIDRKNPEYAVTRSYSLVGTECTGVRGDPGNHTFLYEGLTPKQIIHVSNVDSGSGSGMHDEFGQKTDRVFRVGSPSELLSNTRSYNELIILEKGTVNTSENTSLNDIKPIAIYCYEITEETVKTAKEYGVGIALINNNKYNKNNSKNKGHNTIFEDYMYPGQYQKSTDYYYAKDGRRNELCTFEDMDKIDDMIEGRNNEEQTIDNQKENNSDYFNGKSHQFEVTGTQARSNSENMDKILSEINEQNKSEKLEELRKTITEQYKESTGEELQLSNEQLLSILDAHEQDGKLGELTLGQLRVKVKILSEAITDPKVRRFLLEAGFCGTEVSNNIDGKENDTNIENLDSISKETLDLLKQEDISVELYNEYKEFLNKLLPEEYKYLINDYGIIDFIKLMNKKNTKDLEIDDRDSFSKAIQEIIKNNIQILKEYTNIENKDYDKLPMYLIFAENLENAFKTFQSCKIKINKLDELNDIKEIIIDFNTTYKDNIEVLKEAGVDFTKIKNISELNDIKEIITSYRTKKNIEALKEAGVDFTKIKNISELNDIKEIITSYSTKENIKTLKEAGVDFTKIKNINELNDIKEIITNNSTKENIEALKEAGVDFTKIKNISELNDIKEIVTDNSTKENIEALKEAGVDFTKIKNINELNDIKEIITSYNTKENIEALKEAGVDFTKIKNINELNDIKEIITSYSTKENIKTLKEAGVDFTKIKNINELNDIKEIVNVIKLGDSTIIKENIEALKELGINDIENYLKLQNLISSGDSRRVKENITVLRELGINDVKDYSKLEYLIVSLDGTRIKERITALRKLGINDVEDYYKLQNLITSSNFQRIKENIAVLKELGINDIEEYLRLQIFISSGDSLRVKENITVLKELGINDVKDYSKLEYLIINLDGTRIKEKITALRKLGINDVEDYYKLQNFITSGDLQKIKENIAVLKELGINDIKECLRLQDLITSGDSQKIKENITVLKELGINDIEEYLRLQDLIKYGDSQKIKGIITVLKELGINDIQEYYNLKNLILYRNIPDYTFLKELGINNKTIYYKLQNIIMGINVEFKESNHKGYAKYVEKIIELEIPENIKSRLISDISKLSFSEIDNYLQNFKEFCIDKGLSYDKFLKCFDGKTCNLKLLDFATKGFEVKGIKTDNDSGILNNSIKQLYPKLDIEFNENEAKKIMEFIDNIGGINKGYSILILTIEKMVRDGVNSKDFNSVLIEKLGNYMKVFDMYPEDKIPDGLKISIGLEIEMTRMYAERYKNTTGNDYQEVVKNITGDSKTGKGKDGIHEFATKPSTNPMVTLLEIHLLQELNLLDINDMQKLSGNTEGFNYKSRNGTGYHLNIGSDADIGIDENIQFIQNFCTILPRSGISNGENVSKLNRYSNIRSKTSEFSVFPDSNSKNYIELRTYSVDDVELFEKNVIFNTYAVMGSQAMKKVLKSNTPRKVIDLKDNEEINSAEDVLKYLEENELFSGERDLKSKKIAAEFMFMQIRVLRAIDDYNQNFIDSELFGEDLEKDLSEPWKDFMYDILLSDNKETIGFDDMGMSSMYVKRNTNLNESFNAQEYIHKSEPFTDEDTKEILNKTGNKIPEERIALVTKRLNKKLLWSKLCEGCPDTQELENKLKNKVSNIDRIKSYIRLTDQTAKIDRQYLYNYFERNLSLEKNNLYYPINTDFVNTIINLNNFFLKKDDTNANNVLQTTKYEGGEETDISKSSIFETGGYMRKGYNYYQGGSDNMLIHISQRIALDYMEQVKDILTEPEDKNQTLQETEAVKLGESNDYFDGKSNSEGLIFNPEYVTQKDDGIYRFNTKETTNTQKNKPGYQSLQEAEQSLNNQIGGKYDKKLYQESFTKEHKNEDFEEDVDDFIKYATEKELNHKQIFLDLAKEASAKALFIGRPKKKDRIIEKVRNELLKEGEGLEALTDFTRATILFDNFSDFEEGLKVLEQMKNEGRILDLKIRNRLTRPGCNDIFVNIQTPDGYVSEVQFHIPEVLVFRDEKLGDLSIDRYKSDDNILDKHTLTKDIFDLSNDKYKRNLEAYNKIIDRLNEGRDKDHLLSLPKEQNQIVYDHDMYDIIRVLELYENADNLTLEDYELFTSKGFRHENIKDLLNDLRLMKENLCNEALNRYRKRTK